MLIRVSSFIFDLLMNWNKCYRKLNFLCIGENSFIAIKFNPSSVFFFFFFFFFFLLEGEGEDRTSPSLRGRNCWEFWHKALY